MFAAFCENHASKIGLRNCFRYTAMPIRVLLHGNVSSEPEDITSLTTAFELALSKLELPDRQDPLAVVLAKFIIELAKDGERDPQKLCDEALMILRQNAKR